MSKLSTNAALLQALEKAAKEQLTPEERRRQRVSFIMGSLSDRSTLTRDRVEEELRKLEGKAA